MINSAAFMALPQAFGNICKIYPPLVKDAIGNPHFGQYKKILTFTQEEIEYELRDQLKGEKAPTPFEFVLANCYHHEQFLNLTLQAFYFFLKEPVKFLYEEKIIILGTQEEMEKKVTNKEGLRIITEEDFFEFQNAIREACGEQRIKPPEPDDPNLDPRIKRIKEKARMRDAIKAKKGTQNKDGITFDTCLVAICCMGIGITPLNIGEMSYASIQPILKMRQEKEKYELDVKTLLAGGDSKKIKPKYWIRNSD